MQAYTVPSDRLSFLCARLLADLASLVPWGVAVTGVAGDWLTCCLHVIAEPCQVLYGKVRFSCGTVAHGQLDTRLGLESTRRSILATLRCHVRCWYLSAFPSVLVLEVEYSPCVPGKPCITELSLSLLCMLYFEKGPH